MLKARCYRLAPLLFGGNHVLVIFAQNICIRNCFFGLKMQNSPWGHPLPDPPRSVASLTRNSPRRLLTEGFGDMELIFSPIIMSKISIWYFLIHDELLENCYEKFVIKVFKIRLILHYRASIESRASGPLSGPWTPAA